MGAGWEWPEAADYVREPSKFDLPSFFAETISKSIPIKAHRTTILDIGCGRGIVGLYCLAKRQAAFVTFSDIQEMAIAETRRNANLLVQERRIGSASFQFTEPAPFAQLQPSLVCEHDLIAFNPPQLPAAYIDEKTQEELQGDDYRSLFRLAGPDGLKIVREFVSWYSRLPRERPDAFIMLSSFLGWSNITKSLRADGVGYELSHERRIVLRNILCPAAETFQSNEHELAERALMRQGTTWSKKLYLMRLYPY